MMGKGNECFDPRSPILRLFDTIAAMARQAGLADDPRVIKTLRAMACNPTDVGVNEALASETINLIRSHPDYIAAAEDQNPFKPAPGAEASGPYLLGRVYAPHGRQPIPFGLFEREINENVLVCGRAGAGKTVILMLLLHNLLRHSKPFLCIDFKRDYRSLLGKCRRLLVFNWKNFRFNPLAPPPGVDSAYWLNIVADVFFQTFFSEVPLAAKTAFIDLLNCLYMQWADKYGEGIYPSLQDVDDVIGSDGAQSGAFPGNYRERLRTCQSRIRPLLAMIGPMLDCSEGFAIEELLQQPVVIELDGLTDEVQAFLSTILFFWIFAYRLNAAQRGVFRHVLVCDEAKLVFSKERASGSSPISRFVSTAREFGQGILVGEQMPSTLGHAILANVHVTICLSLAAARDIHEIGYAMGLGSIQRDLVGRLPLGMGIVKIAGRIFRPFLVQFPDYPIDKCVSDDKVAADMAGHWDGLRVSPRPVATVPEAGVRNTVFEARSSESPAAQTDFDESNAPPESKTVTSGLNDKEEMVFADIKARPFVSVTERTRSLRLTTYLMNRILRRLLVQGLVEAQMIHEGRRGKPSKYFALTEKGRRFSGPQNLGPGKGGFEHVFHQQRLQKAFAALGYEVSIEAFQNGKSADLGLRRDGRSIAVEIEMSEGGAVSNIQKDLAAGWNEVWVAAKDSKILERIRSQWSLESSGGGGGCVEFFLVTDLPLSSG